MSDYLLQWGWAYLVHFGAWVSLGLGVTVHKNGLPEPKQIPKILIAAIAFALVAAIFSSHSHTHYLTHSVK